MILRMYGPEGALARGTWTAPMPTPTQTAAARRA
jgi:hypothetical protein